MSEEIGLNPESHEPLYTADEMRTDERRYAGPTLDLMECAGAAVSSIALSRYSDARSFAVWCGTGANGGDGFVIARKLHEAGKDVAIRLLGSEKDVQGDAAQNLTRAKELGLVLSDEWRPAEVVVDSLFGTGFSGSPRREAARHIEAINELESHVISVDIPSGVDASTGEVAGPAVSADLSVTFHGLKVGHVIAPGRFHTGEIEVVDLHVPQAGTVHRRLTRAVINQVPRRGEIDNKYTAGAVLVIGGSTGLSGAPSLSSEAALRAGAGIVIACVPEPLNPVFELRLLEVISRPCAADEDGHLVPEALDQIAEEAKRVDAVVLGPGLGRTDGTRELVRLVLETIELPMVVDADALWALVGHLDWVFARGTATVLTPHAGELGRLISRPSAWVNHHRLQAAQSGADETGSVVALKGVDTIVATPNRGVLVSDLGNPGLATAGSGDVLTGIVGAFLAKGMQPQLAVASASATAGLAAHRASQTMGTAGLIARDVVNTLSPIVSQLEG